MTFSKLFWFFQRKRIFIVLCLDYLILFILIFLKKYSYNDIEILNWQNIFNFSLIWFALSYVHGLYVFRLNLFLLDSIKIVLVNTSKLSISFSFIYLVNSIFLKKNFLSNVDSLFSINFIIIYILLSCLLHILLIFITYKKDSIVQNWILVGDRKYEKIFNNKIFNLKISHKIKVIDDMEKLKSFDFNTTNFKGIIFTPDKIEQGIDFSFLKKNNLLFFTIKDWCQVYIQRFPPEIIINSDILKINNSINDRKFAFNLKRIGDISFSAFLLVSLSPFLLFFSILIFLEDRKPVLYSQIRTGLNLKKFRIYKLRTMKHNSEKKGAQWAVNNDKRISRVGRILRSTRIDELPQLFSVLKGEMSLIGPRPERPEFDEILDEKIPFYNTRYLIKPGLSGWAQVNYPYGASIEDSYNKLSYDLFYIENFSFFLDFLIFIKTIKLVINAKGSEKGSNL